MTELQTKQLALLEDIIKFFNSENRCTDNQDCCKYYFEGKEGCAIGRLIPDKELCKKLDLGIGEYNTSGVSNIEVFKLLPKELQYYEQEFLYRLQRLHDIKENWNSSGLTEKGQFITEDIKETFGLN